MLFTGSLSESVKVASLGDFFVEGVSRESVRLSVGQLISLELSPTSYDHRPSCRALRDRALNDDRGERGKSNCDVTALLQMHWD